MVRRSAPGLSIAATVASATPVSAPFQPAWAAPTTRAFRSANSSGPQSALDAAMARPGTRVTTPSARGRSPPGHGLSATTTSAEWIW